MALDEFLEASISFGGMRIDRAVAAEVIDRLAPLGIEAALGAEEARSRASDDKRRQLEPALEQARYEVGHARRQYDSVDPDNRLVGVELEKRRNDRLMVVRDFEVELEGLTANPAADLSPEDRARLMSLGTDLDRAWRSEGVTWTTRKRIVRTLVDEIVVRVEDNSLDLVRVLARQMPDKAIASVLNRAGKTTGRGNGWTQSRVCSLRSHNDIATYREGERRERGEVMLDEAAEALVVGPSTVRRLIKEGDLNANQLCKGARWVIRAKDLERREVRLAADARRLRRPPSADPLQNELDLQ